MIQTHFLGPHPLIRHYLARLNVEGILRSHLPQGRTGALNHGQAICVLVHNILASPGPLYRLENWVAPIEPGALGLTTGQKGAINDDRVGRALDALGSPRAREVWFHLALRTIKQWRLSTERVHFDTTSVTFFGEYTSSVDEPRMDTFFTPGYALIFTRGIGIQLLFFRVLFVFEATNPLRVFLL